MFDSVTKQPARGFVPLKQTGFWNGSNAFGEVEQSVVSTPPLWRISPDSSPQHHLPTNYRCLSPRSKSEAIARGQKELMDMVSNMPECCYELSLKDIVENKPNLVEEEGLLHRNEVNKRVVNGSVKRVERRGVRMNRSESMESGGLLLKMVFPVSFGAKKGKKNGVRLGRNSFSKDCVNVKADKVDDKGWWKKRPSFSGENESGRWSINSGYLKNTGSSSSSIRSNSSGSSTNSNSIRNIRNEGNGLQPSCWSFIGSKNSKMAE